MHKFHSKILYSTVLGNSRILTKKIKKYPKKSMTIFAEFNE